MFKSRHGSNATNIRSTIGEASQADGICTLLLDASCMVSEHMTLGGKGCVATFENLSSKIPVAKASHNSM